MIWLESSDTFSVGFCMFALAIHLYFVVTTNSIRWHFQCREKEIEINLSEDVRIKTNITQNLDFVRVKMCVSARMPWMRKMILDCRMSNARVVIVAIASSLQRQCFAYIYLFPYPYVLKCKHNIPTYSKYFVNTNKHTTNKLWVWVDYVWQLFVLFCSFVRALGIPYVG